MVPKILSLVNGVFLRVFSKTNETELVYNASSINEYLEYQANQLDSNQPSTWFASDDIELLTIWLLLPDGISDSTTMVFTVNNFVAQVWQFTLTLETFTKYGTSAFYTFPVTSLIRKNWSFYISASSPINGISIIARNCHINDPIRSQVLPGA
jgi:hypothetical protein